MKMNNLGLVLLLAGTMIFSACGDDEIKTSEVNLSLTVTNTIEGLHVTSGTYVFSNVSTGLETSVPYTASVSTVLPDGLYNVSFTGEASYTNPKSAEETIVPVKIQGSQQNVEVKGGVCRLELSVHILNTTTGFVIAEIFGTGTFNQSTNKQYNGDQYFRVFNNSNKTLYADGLILLESKFITVTKNDYTPDKMNEAMTVQVVAMIPGDGKTYPVEPGKSIVICDNAINHKEANPVSVDLSEAAFEWFTNSTSATNPDIDNPSVTNLDMIYNYSKTVWSLAKQGNRAYALGRLPENVSTDSYLKDYTYTYIYTTTTGKPSKEFLAYYFPNNWVIDAVNLSPKNEYVWNVTSQVLDMGYTWFGLNGTVSENYGKAIVRKVSYMDGERQVLQDTNNSSVDFEPAASATLIK